MVQGSRPVIDGTLQGPDVLIELVAFHRHRLGAARAQVVTIAADGAPWIWARLDWVIAPVKLDPAPVVEVPGPVSPRASSGPGVGGVGIWPRTRDRSSTAACAGS